MARQVTMAPLVVRFVHLLAVLTWVGGMLFVAVVLVPVARRLEDAALRTRLVQDVGRRFRTVGWIALMLIVATGFGNLARSSGRPARRPSVGAGEGRVDRPSEPASRPRNRCARSNPEGITRRLRASRFARHRVAFSNREKPGWRTAFAKRCWTAGISARAV